MANKTSQHILNTSATLLGFCLFVITSLRIANQTEKYFLDELTSVIAILLTVSSLFSFFSIRAKNSLREDKLELIADYFFVIALVGILIIILLITFNLLK
jgi:hypothetical protein